MPACLWVFLLVRLPKNSTGKIRRKFRGFIGIDKENPFCSRMIMIITGGNNAEIEGYQGASTRAAGLRA